MTRVGTEDATPHSHVRPLDVVGALKVTSPPQALHGLGNQHVSPATHVETCKNVTCTHVHTRAHTCTHVHTRATTCKNVQHVQHVQKTCKNVLKNAKTCKNVQKRSKSFKNVQKRSKTFKNVQKRSKTWTPSAFKSYILLHM